MRKIVFNKKGEMTSEEIAKLVLSVVGLIVLIILSVALYNMFVSNTKKEQARFNLENIVNSINRLEAGEMTHYLVTSPNDWFIVGYKQSDIAKDPSNLGAPLICGKSDCLCICPAGNNPQLIPVGIRIISGVDTGEIARNAFYFSASKCPETRTMVKDVNTLWGAFKQSIGKPIVNLFNKPDFCFREKCGSEGVCRPVANLSFDVSQEMFTTFSDPPIYLYQIPWIAIGDDNRAAIDINLSKDLWGSVKVSANVPMNAALKEY